MIDLLDSAPFSSIGLCAIAAVICFPLGLITKQSRIALVFGLVFGLVGLMIEGGRQDRSTGEGWGVVATLIFGVGGGCTGFLLGFGGFLLTAKGHRLPGVVVILIGLMHPLSFWAEKNIRPRLIEREWQWWEVALAEGLPPAKKADAPNHLSRPTRSALIHLLEPRSGRHFPETTLLALDDLGLLNSSYEPMPADIARRKYARNPKDPFLAQNPTIPVDLMRQMSERQISFLVTFLHNPAIPEEVLATVRTRLTMFIAEESRKADPAFGQISEARDCLKIMDSVRQQRERNKKQDAAKQDEKH